MIAGAARVRPGYGHIPTTADFIARGRAAGQDALGAANDPEAVAAVDVAKLRAALNEALDGWQSAFEDSQSEMGAAWQTKYAVQLNAESDRITELRKLVGE